MRVSMANFIRDDLAKVRVAPCPSEDVLVERCRDLLSNVDCHGDLLIVLASLRFPNLWAPEPNGPFSAVPGTRSDLVWGSRAWFSRGGSPRLRRHPLAPAAATIVGVVLLIWVAVELAIIGHWEHGRPARSAWPRNCPMAGCS